MKTIEECVVTAMDGTNKEIFRYLPYILQDVWEFGANPEAVIGLINKYFAHTAGLNVLDLGCGKGAVSIKVSQALGCRCHGIDAIAEFIEFARHKAAELKVNHRCTFETADIRQRVHDLSGFDIIVLGAIGPVFGDYYQTLTTLVRCLNQNGVFIIDDGYIQDSSDFIHPLIAKKSTILSQIEMAGMKLVEDDRMDREHIKDSDDFIFEKLKKRCLELVEKFPHKQHLFLDYIKQQEIENDILENKIVGTTLLIKRK
jgi:ubiquinone/menaquinone biosynthesis C-methylase UbiE